MPILACTIQWEQITSCLALRLNCDNSLQAEEQPPDSARAQSFYNPFTLSQQSFLLHVVALGALAFCVGEACRFLHGVFRLDCPSHSELLIFLPVHL